LSSFYALWTWKKAWFRQPEALLSKRAKCNSEDVTGLSCTVP